jgi:preprotein translocase subunit YajC
MNVFDAITVVAVAVCVLLFFIAMMYFDDRTEQREHEKEMKELEFTDEEQDHE